MILELVLLSLRFASLPWEVPAQLDARCKGPRRREGKLFYFSHVKLSKKLMFGAGEMKWQLRALVARAGTQHKNSVSQLSLTQLRVCDALL